MVRTRLAQWITYKLRNPVAWSIYPFMTSLNVILQDVNPSLPFTKRLPTEVLQLVGDELHNNALRDDIRATWTPIVQPFAAPSDDLIIYKDRVPLKLKVDLIPGTTRYHGVPHSRRSHLLVRSFGYDISSADLLYRLLCYFPEIYTGLNHPESSWEAGIRHNQTGLILLFFDNQTVSDVLACYTQTDVLHAPQSVPGDEFTQAVLDIFESDSIRLLNAFFETVNDGSRRMSYYHPAADADIPTEKEYYAIVPYFSRHPGIDLRIELDAHRKNPFRKWYHDKTSATQDASLYPSILQNLPYDTRARKIDHRSKDAMNLTTVISSAFLLYRLVCTYSSHNIRCPLIHSFVNEGRAMAFNSLTGVWQFELVHRETHKSVIFMDNHGLFDIRAGEMTEEEIYDLEGLVEWLCRDTCPHPSALTEGLTDGWI